MKLNLGYSTFGSEAERLSQGFNSREKPRLPGPEVRAPRRWEEGPTWTPADGALLVRHRAVDGSRRIVTNSRTPPDGFVIEYDLGIVHRRAQPGAHRLIERAGTYECTASDRAVGESWRALGYVQQAPLAMLDVLELRLDPRTGQQILVCGTEDPLYPVAVPQATLGFIESYPLNPRRVIDTPLTRGLVTLVRTADDRRWRHRYSVRKGPADSGVRLGGIWETPRPGAIELRVTGSGWLETDDCPARHSRPALARKLVWAGSPVAWSQQRDVALRAVARRLYMLVRPAPRPAKKPQAVLGYVRSSPAPGWSPLFVARHPALSDQYVTRSELEARDMGYETIGILGYAADAAADGENTAMPRAVKWASRFGLGRRYVEGAARLIESNPS